MEGLAFKKSRIVGYIWYNPEQNLYQCGEKDEYWGCYAKSNNKELCSLILELKNESDLLENRLVKELNSAHDQLMSQSLKAIG